MSSSAKRDHERQTQERDTATGRSPAHGATTATARSFAAVARAAASAFAAVRGSTNLRLGG